MSRAFDAAFSTGSSRGEALPWLIAEAFGISPREVLEWPEELFRDARQWLNARRRHERRQGS